MKTSIKRSSRFLPLCFLIAVIFMGFIGFSPDKLFAEEKSTIRTKASFFYHHSKFVVWPEDRFSERNLSINLCIFEEDPFGKELDLMIQSRTKRENFIEKASHLHKKLIIRRLVKIENKNDCHLLFIGASERKFFGKILKELNGSSVLTLSDQTEFIQSGGMVYLAHDQEKVRFEINLDLAQKAGLKISSKFLRLAKVVSLQASNRQ